MSLRSRGARSSRSAPFHLQGNSRGVDLSEYVSSGVDLSNFVGFGQKGSRGEILDYKSVLISFYSINNPEMVAHVDAILQDWIGRETRMFDNLARKYNTKSPLSLSKHTPLAFTSRLPSLPGPETRADSSDGGTLSNDTLHAVSRLVESDNDSMRPDIPTSAITFVESAHGRLRREQRGICKKDLQGAVKYGKRDSGRERKNGETTSIYTYKNIVYIKNDVSGEEVTSYALPIVLDKVNISQAIQKQHDKALLDIEYYKKQWKSNTVIVVDTSGSMRNCDVWDTKTRLDAVWLSLALDFIAQRIESEGAGEWDVVSIVSLGPAGEIILKEQPTTWVLYNKIVDFYNERVVRAKGHGMYVPSLDIAEMLLHRNKNSSCAMGLMFISDGKPSDHCDEKQKGMATENAMDDIVSRVEDLSKKFGRRLTFSTVGIGDSDDFDTLRKMVDAASDFGVQASFKLPSRSSSGIGTAFSSVSTSITNTQTELTDVGTLRQREVRSVVRESRQVASRHIYHVDDDEFYIYKPENISRKVYQEWNEGRNRMSDYKHAPLQDPSAQYVAISKAIFGEGAERFAYRFYEIAADAQTIVGSPLVAKESRHVLEHGGENRKDFVKQFCRTQQSARRIAEEFNSKLDSIKLVDERTPRVDVLDCSIYYLKDKNLGELATLVEPRLDHNKWHKWNANNGYVEGMESAPKLSEAALEETEELLKNRDLGAIEEGSEDEEDSDSDSESSRIAGPTTCVFTPSEVAQAFSHFSYWASGRRRLICDLQGVYDEKANLIMLSDPVIHYYNHRMEHRQNVHGMTDRGRKGIKMFFATHECSRLCNHMINGFKDAHRKRHQWADRNENTPSAQRLPSRPTHQV